MPDRTCPRLRTTGLFLACSLIFTFFLAAYVSLASGEPAGKAPYLPVLMNGWPPPGRLVLSEVLYDPLAEEPSGEWIEVYNAGGNSLDLSLYRLGDAEFQGDSEGMFAFPPGTLIASKQVVVVANQALAFAQEYGLSFPILYDLDGSVNLLYQVRSLPTSFFIDPQGVIHEVVIGGPMSEALLRIRVQQLLVGFPQNPFPEAP